LRALHDAGVTIIVITHRPSLVSHVDKILVLQAGRIQQFGPASQVRKSLRPLHAATSAA
jgi:ABC-type protease/lipase transport system fused ATPase/permease subunit